MTGRDFGAALAMLDHTGDGRLDLTVGSAGMLNDDDYRTRGRLVTLFARRRGIDTQHVVGIDWTSVGVAKRTVTGLGMVIGH